MKKIPTMFERDWNGDRSRVIDKPHPDCGWVFAGEGVATRKYDGTSVLVDSTSSNPLWRRREVKPGQTPPMHFVQETRDEETGKLVGWIPVGDGPEDRWHREAYARQAPLPGGTYELLGPHIQGNPERVPEDTLFGHRTAQQYSNAPRTFDALRDWLTGQDIEGIVFHHPDGRMAKIKLRDFGLKRPTTPEQSNA